ncbi:hypothetical protein TVAG_497920 [Trichomonas vaginalis G3]|uniref:Uncharacterized protein n=1 Tax=Trichomonas vaginalis (strain ATCC PRA-98 / G3) TaxID=412133 RepID=A2FVB1_TRIV3|nr:hypothetical protein TVAGG3_0148510 [Trichomonas vaginalis G3]EAX91151.1 hypothetical protein TVAG_497920 [Trichomonas vaginalis G3]KAI5547105.1 hypothetical protein TVAGG3_0148510 [Trichomonas vaginalis G3]|eukprot:XP_001304081.1 hypothetical protein [Trichomonas vaginalis G3]
MFTTKSINLFIDDKSIYCVNYQIKGILYKSNYLGLYTDKINSYSISHYYLNAQKNEFNFNLKVSSNLTIVQDTSGMFQIKKNSPNNEILTLTFGSVGFEEKLNSVPIFDGDTTNSTFNIDLSQYAGKIISYLKLYPPLKYNILVQFDTTKYHPTDVIIYSNGKQIKFDNSNQTLLLNKSTISMSIDAKSNKDLRNIRISFDTTETQTFKPVPGPERDNNPSNKKTIAAVVASIAVFYVIGITSALIIYFIGKRHFNRLYGSLMSPCLCCCTNCEGYYEVVDFYQSHPRYYYDDYNAFGCRKCENCYDNHCNNSRCFYSCGEKLCQPCYARHNYALIYTLRLLFGITSLIIFPVICFITAIHLLCPSIRDDDYETNYADQHNQYKTPIVISKFYNKFKLKGKNYSNAKNEIDNHEDSSDGGSSSCSSASLNDIRSGKIKPLSPDEYKPEVIQNLDSEVMKSQNVQSHKTISQEEAAMKEQASHQERRPSIFTDANIPAKLSLSTEDFSIDAAPTEKREKPEIILKQPESPKEERKSPIKRNFTEEELERKRRKRRVKSAADAIHQSLKMFEPPSRYDDGSDTEPRASENPDYDNLVLLLPPPDYDSGVMPPMLPHPELLSPPAENIPRHTPKKHSRRAKEKRSESTIAEIRQANDLDFLF